MSANGVRARAGDEPSDARRRGRGLAAQARGSDPVETTPRDPSVRSSAPTPRAKSQIRPRGCYSMLSMMPDLLRKAKQRQTTRRGWRCGGARPGWQQNQAHDLGQTISRVCCTPRLSSSRSERTTGRSWCCNVTRALDASWNALSLGFGGAQFLHRASDG